jgi:hypothetical protein
LVRTCNAVEGLPSHITRGSCCSFLNRSRGDCLKLYVQPLRAPWVHFRAVVQGTHDSMWTRSNAAIRDRERDRDSNIGFRTGAVRGAAAHSITPAVNGE